MIMFLTHLYVFVALLIATIVDLKKREVPDTVSYATIILAITVALLHSLLIGSTQPFITMALGMGLCLLIGAVMFFAGQWGGGDAKLIIGLGGFFGATTFLYEFLLLTIIAGAVYGIGFGVYLAIQRRETFKKTFRNIRTKKSILRMRIAFQILIVISLLLVFFVIQEQILRLTIVILAAGLYLVFYAWMFSKALDECMKVQLPVSKLVEGDWVLGEITTKGKTIEAARFGITKKQIDELKKHKVKKVLVKEGIPFVPSFMLAYLAAITLQLLGISPIALLF